MSARQNLDVPSVAMAAWTTGGLARLAELENVHVQATGSARGRRWGTEQLNRSLLVMLVAQFQSYCRHLHDAAVDIHVALAVPGQQVMVLRLLTQDRKLDTQNPRRAALGADFGRLGFRFIDQLKASGEAAEDALSHLELLIDFRNAVGHGDEAAVAAIGRARGFRATKAQYTQSRRIIEGLVVTMDDVVADQLDRLLGIGRPW